MKEQDNIRKICESLNREVSFVNGSGRSMYAYECVDNSVTFVQYQAGAMGGNYQKANKIVYFTLPLGKGSCDLWEQSKKRIHRIGQNRPCYYYYLLVKGSFEERNLAALKKHGITSETIKNMILGAGVIYKNLKYEKSTSGWTGTPLGATSGGLKFNYEAQWLDVEVDGATVLIKGVSKQKVGESATLEGQMTELTEVGYCHLLSNFCCVGGVNYASCSSKRIYRQVYRRRSCNR